MKKLLFLSILLTPFINMADQIDDLKFQLTTEQDQLKIYQSEVDIYNQSIKPMNQAKTAIANSSANITNLTNKLEPLTGIVIRNGSTTYNNNPSSNDYLTKLNTKLQQEIDTLTSENTLTDQSLVAARATLGDLRGKAQTAERDKNISFYQGKAEEYKKSKSDSEAKIQKNRDIINRNNSAIALNTSQIKDYQTQIDTAKNTIADNQKIVDEWTSKLNATPDKINFNNITGINNKMHDLQSQIDYLNSQIASSQATTGTATPAPADSAAPAVPASTPSPAPEIPAA